MRVIFTGKQVKIGEAAAHATVCSNWRAENGSSILMQTIICSRTKVARQANFVNERPDIDIVIGPTTRESWSEDGVRRELTPIPEPHDFWTMLASWALPQTGAPLWRKS